MITWLKKLLSPKPLWQYGTCTTESQKYGQSHRIARRNRRTGEVQFVIWPKGHKTASGYVYEEDFWTNYDSYWWPNFKPNP